MQRRHFDTIKELSRALKDIALPSLPSGRPRESSLKTVLSARSARKMLYRETEWFFFCYFVTTFAPKESPARTLKQQEAFRKEAPQRKDTTTTPITLAITATHQIWPWMQRQPPVASLTFKRIVWQSPGGRLGPEETLHHCRGCATHNSFWLTCLFSTHRVLLTCLLQVLLFLPSSAFSIEGTVSLALRRASARGTSRAEVVVSTWIQATESSQPICIFITSESKYSSSSSTRSLTHFPFAVYDFLEGPPLCAHQCDCLIRNLDLITLSAMKAVPFCFALHPFVRQTHSARRLSGSIAVIAAQLVDYIRRQIPAYSQQIQQEGWWEDGGGECADGFAIKKTCCWIIHPAKIPLKELRSSVVWLLKEVVEATII